MNENIITDERERQRQRERERERQTEREIDREREKGGRKRETKDGWAVKDHR